MGPDAATGACMICAEEAAGIDADKQPRLISCGSQQHAICASCSMHHLLHLEEDMAMRKSHLLESREPQLVGEMTWKVTLQLKCAAEDCKAIYDEKQVRWMRCAAAHVKKPEERCDFPKCAFKAQNWMVHKPDGVWTGDRWLREQVCTVGLPAGLCALVTDSVFEDWEVPMWCPVVVCRRKSRRKKRWRRRRRRHITRITCSGLWNRNVEPWSACCAHAALTLNAIKITCE